MFAWRILCNPLWEYLYMASAGPSSSLNNILASSTSPPLRIDIVAVILERNLSYYYYIFLFASRICLPFALFVLSFSSFSSFLDFLISNLFRHTAANRYCFCFARHRNHIAMATFPLLSFSSPFDLDDKILSRLFWARTMLLSNCRPVGVFLFVAHF